MRKTKVIRIRTEDWLKLKDLSHKATLKEKKRVTIQDIISNLLK